MFHQPDTQQLPIAVIGLNALLPGSPDVAGFWRAVIDGRDLITEVPTTHWLVDDYYDPDPSAIDKTYARRGAFLDPIDFDPIAYGVPPNTIQATDTTQLLALLVADKLLKDVTAQSAVDRDKVSVILGTGPLDLLTSMSNRLQRPVWLKALRESGVPEDEAQSICDRIADHYVPWQEASFPGLLSNVVAGRIANKLDLHGTNCTTDAACASSMAAISMAVNELALGQADMVITGGVDTLNDILMYMCFSKTPALSPTGDCRPFSDKADGTMLGEGLVMFALKRLVDAERDGDTIYSVIRGIGKSSDGRGTAIYAPVAAGQARALRAAYAAAGYGPDTVELVEAHGTGTKAGDIAEFEALRSVFAESSATQKQWCALGTVKSQVGHTKSAAGATGLLKAVLALHHKVLPPTIKVEKPNSGLNIESSPLYLNTQARPWIRDASHPRRASVSSFGFGGSNFHLTVEEYQTPAGQAPRMRTHPAELVVLSADKATELVERAQSLLSDGRELTEIAWDAQQHLRADDEFRLAITATDQADLRAKASSAVMAIRKNPAQNLELPGGVSYATGLSDAGEIAFLFPGQGSQYIGMGADLAMHFPEARQIWDATADLTLADSPLHQVVFPIPAFTDEERQAQEKLLTATEWAQPALAATSMALLAVLDALGVKESYLAGHSLGELTALYRAGAFDGATLLRLVRRRGELMRDSSSIPGAMIAAAASPRDIEQLVFDGDQLWIANHNSPTQTVISGSDNAILELETRLDGRGITHTRLNAATAFHSPLVASASDPLLEFLTQQSVSSPQLPVYGNTDAAIYPSNPELIRRRIAEHLAAPIRFVDEIEALHARGARTFIEVGSGDTLTKLVGQILGDRPHLAICMDRKNRNGVLSLYQAIGQLAVHGVPLDFSALWHDYLTKEVSEKPKSGLSVKLSGANYDRPYPPPGGAAELPLPNPHRVQQVTSLGEANMSDNVQPPIVARQQNSVTEHYISQPAHNGSVVNGHSDWLRIYQESQRQTAEAHASYQRLMAESHGEFLRTIESSLAGLTTILTGHPVQSVPNQPISRPLELPSIATTAQNGFVQNGFAQNSTVMQPAPVWFEPVVPENIEQPPNAIPAEEPKVALPVEPAAEPVAGNIDIEALLLAVIAEKTGYPVEMLGTHMELEADLGIDSIKRVEILSALRTQAPDLPEVSVQDLNQLRSLGQIISKLRGAETDSPRPGSAAESFASAKLTEPGEPHPPPLSRKITVTKPSSLSGLAMSGLADGLIAVTPDGAGIANAVAEKLIARGLRATVVTDIPAEATGVIFLGGLRDVPDEDAAIAVNYEAFQVAKSVAERFAKAGGLFVTVQDTGGDFGLSGMEPMRSWLGGIAALTKTALREWPKVSAKTIDCQRNGRAPNEIADDIVRELCGGGGDLEVGLLAGGSRVVVDLVDQTNLAVGSPKIGPESVLVVTGGARGVTSRALLALAKAHHPKLALIGRTELADEPEELRGLTDEAALKRAVIDITHRRTGRMPTPVEVSPAVHSVLASREVRATLDKLASAGCRARYISVDARDSAALAAALNEVRTEWGPITGIVHGAGIIADKLIVDKTAEQFTSVFETKIASLRALLSAAANDPLTVICLFSSVAAHYGNSGQSDYAMANEVLNQIAAVQQRKRPECLVRSIAWGPWDGGMVTPDLAEYMRARGIPLIPLAAGAKAFVAELDGPDYPVRVMLTSGDADQALGDRARADIHLEVQVSEQTHPYLADHAITDTPVLPVAMALEWFSAAAHVALASEHGLAVLRDVRVLRKVNLDSFGNGWNRFLIDGVWREETRLGLSLSDSARSPHYQAVATVADAEPGLWPTPEGLKPLATQGIYQEASLFHGSRFQALQEVQGISGQGALATIIGSNELNWPENEWHVDVAAVDGGLQLAVLWASRVLSGPCLPMSINEFRLYKTGAIDQPIRGVVLARQARDVEASCDVGLLDADGSVRVELMGVHVIRRPD